MQRKKMTNADVERFPSAPEDKAKSQPVLWCGEVRGFGCRYFAKSNIRTYFLQYRVKGTGKMRAITIGRHNDPWRVDQARARALEIKALMLGGTDPVEEAERKRAEAVARAKQNEAQSLTLRDALTSYLENKTLRPKTKLSINGNLERYLADWLEKPMATTITREACITRFKNIKAAKLTASYLRAICNHARRITAAEDGTPRIFLANPVTLANEINPLATPAPRKGRIKKERIGHVWNALRKQAQEGRTDVLRAAADWLSFVLLSGTRLTESGALLKRHVNLEAKTFHMPGEVEGVPGFHGTKNHNGLTLPLSTPLIEILTPRMNTESADTPAERRRKRERAEPYVFPSFGVKRPYLTDPRATLELISAVAGGDIAMHDLRRTFTDILRFAKVDPDERRLILNHISGDVQQISYENNDDPENLRPAMQAAADWVLEQAHIAAASNVIPFPEKKTG